jgi:hypothetical protein
VARKGIAGVVRVSQNSNFRSDGRRVEMADLAAAEQHLNKALERLQTALSRRMSGARPLGKELPEDVVALQEECRTLREVAGHAALRLDTTIGELDRLLGE